MPYTDHLFTTSNEKGKTGFIYGSAARDALFLDGQDRLRRFAPLARKALYFYAGDAYDPHQIDYDIEYRVRHTLSNIISAKVQSGHPYDVENAGRFLQSTIEGLMGTEGEYDALHKEKIRTRFNSTKKDIFTEARDRLEAIKQKCTESGLPEYFINNLASTRMLRELVEREKERKSSTHNRGRDRDRGYDMTME